MLEITYVDIAHLKNLPFALEYADHNLTGLTAAYELSGLPIVVNRQTMHILSSQGVLKALETSPKPVAVLWGFWLPQVERAISLILNGGIDGRLLSLPQDANVIDLLLDLDVNLFPALGIDHAYALDLMETVAAGVPIQKSSIEPRPVLGNEWGIPTLDVTCQADRVSDCVKWGTIARSTPLPNSTVHFYTGDEKFFALLKEPLPLVDTGCLNAVELNISIHAAMPRALVISLIYQKRRVSSVWQGKGLPLFVDLNVPERFLDLNMLGVPVRWRPYANRAYAGELDHLDKAYALAIERAGDSNILYLVYGGGKPARDMCAARGWEWIPEDVTVKRAKDGKK
jgi:hypothetical protein